MLMVQAPERGVHDNEGNVAIPHCGHSALSWLLFGLLSFIYILIIFLP